jgi:predicted DNA-binding helix-hairpin-helix protein
MPMVQMEEIVPTVRELGLSEGFDGAVHVKL